MSDNSVNIKNRKARFEYLILDEFIAGIQLVGSEIKSLRDSKASISEAYCSIHNGEVWVRNMYIDEYTNANRFNHEVRRERKLLLNKSEIAKIDKKLKTKGFTLIALTLFINKKGLAKLKIGLAQGKKLHDKRESMKERDTKRDMDRIKKSFG